MHRFILFTLFLLASTTASAFTELKLTDSRVFEGTCPQTRVTVLNGETSILSIDCKNDPIALNQSAFSGKINARKSKVGMSPHIELFLIAQSHHFLQKPNAVVTGGYNTGWSVTPIITLDGGKPAAKSVEIDNVSVIYHLVEVPGYYFLAGITNNGEPMLSRLAHNANKPEANILKNPGEGEVTELKPLADGGLLAIVNYSNGKADLMKLDKQGSVVQKIRLAGGGARAGTNQAGNILVTHRQGKIISAELFSSALKSLWIKNLHSVSGLASRTVQVFPFKGQWVVVGA
ncbi:MAG: hypothetical protein Q8R64_07625, partial [Sulfurimicrobium sp.]|nr:hypothetical protein [Sulfurimicrobium sp.]